MQEDELEYLFFSRSVADKFIQKLKEHELRIGKHWQESKESIHDGIIISVCRTGDIENWDMLWDELDDLFDVYTIEDQQLLEAGEEILDKNVAGVYIQLADGSQTIAAVDPDVLSRVLEVISNDEFSTMVDAIVSSVESPNNAAICKR